MKNNPQGIDVSNRNGKFDWAAWNGHIEFAMAKATEGIDFKDQEFNRNWRHMKLLKLHRFAYHYGHPVNDPSMQARIFTDFVKENGLERGDNFVLDLEDPDGSQPGHVSRWGWTFLKEVNRLCPGHRCLIYTYPAFIEEGNCARLGGWHLWVADYQVPRPALPATGPWRKWTLWQNVGYGLDLDVYNGSLEDLERFCTTTGP